MIHREKGTLWTWEADRGLPPAYAASIAARFCEATAADLARLADAMDLDDVTFVAGRLGGSRRCFFLEVDETIVTYGWVSRGVESVGELERTFDLAGGEVYVWDCRTRPSWRGRGGYSALLSQIIYRLAGEGTSRIWIGASRQNRPSIRGFVNAGFRPVLDLAYSRLGRLTLLWLTPDPAAGRSLYAAACSMMLENNERRWGRLAVGIRRPES